MTEAEWASGRDFDTMYTAAVGRATPRKARLWMVACCRLEAGQFFDPAMSATLEAAERCAEDPAVEAALTGITDRMHAGQPAGSPPDSPEGELWRVLVGAAGLANGEPHQPADGQVYGSARAAVANAVFACLIRRPVEHAPLCAQAVVTAGRLARGDEAAGTSAAHLLRCIFANPFRPVSIDPVWLTSTVVALANGIYQDHAFDRMPILADALQDAGCDNEGMLTHCRSEGVHVPGVLGSGFAAGEGISHAGSGVAYSN